MYDEIEPADVADKPEDGVLTYGMYLEGASWNRKTKSLVDQKPGEMFISMPVIYFIPTNAYKSNK